MTSSGRHGACWKGSRHINSGAMESWEKTKVSRVRLPDPDVLFITGQVERENYYPSASGHVIHRIVGNTPSPLAKGTKSIVPYVRQGGMKSASSTLFLFLAKGTKSTLFLTYIRTLFLSYVKNKIDFVPLVWEDGNALIRMKRQCIAQTKQKNEIERGDKTWTQTKHTLQTFNIYS